VNSIVIDSTSDFRGLCNNIAFSLSLYSGQMCTAPQNIFVPAAGIETNDGKKSFDDVASGIATAIDKLLGEPERAATILGAVQNEATIKRVNDARGLGQVVRDSSAVPVAGFEKARTASPLVLAIDSAHPYHPGVPAGETRSRTLAHLRERLEPLTERALFRSDGDRVEVTLPRDVLPEHAAHQLPCLRPFDSVDIDEDGSQKPTLKRRQPESTDPADSGTGSSSSEGPPKLKKRGEDPAPAATPKPDNQN